MAEKVHFEIVTPTELLLSEEADMVVVPGTEGDFGVLPHHAPLLSSVRPGTVDIHEDGHVRLRLFVRGGFAEVMGTRCTLLAEEAIPVADIDAAGAEAKLKAAQDRFADAGDDGVERRAARRDIRIAEAMLRAAGQAD